jgi:hypothetical protein
MRNRRLFLTSSATALGLFTLAKLKPLLAKSLETMPATAQKRGKFFFRLWNNLRKEMKKFENLPIALMI